MTEDKALKEFEELASKLRIKMLMYDDTLYWAKYYWLAAFRKYHKEGMVKLTEENMKKLGWTRT